MREYSGTSLKPTIRVAALTPLHEAIAETGSDPAKVLGSLGIAPHLVSDGYAQISLVRYIELLEQVADQTSIPNLGLRMAMRLRASDLGPVGVLFSLSASIEDGLSRLVENSNILQDGIHTSLSDEDGDLILTYQVSDGTIRPRRQDAEFSLGLVCQMVRQSFSHAWHPLEVHLEHRPPADVRQLRKFFRAPILFNQSTNRLIINLEDARQRRPIPDPGLVDILEHHISDLRSRAKTFQSLSDKVSRIIVVNLGQRPLTLSKIAEECEMSVRSFQRELAAEGTSLRQLLKQHRVELAKNLLEKDDLPLADVAAKLGYSDSTVLWRARRGWTRQ